MPRMPSSSSLYEERIKRQSQEIQEIYYSWLEDCERQKLKGMNGYKSTVTEFIDKCIKCPILEIDFDTIESFIVTRNIKTTTRNNKVSHLIRFFSFIKRKHPITKWDFEVEDLKLLEEETKDKVSAEPLTVKQLIKLYQFFSDHKQDRKWLESYMVFRLMYAHELNKFDIADINNKTYDSETGVFKKNKAASPITFAEDIRSIFKQYGPNFLPAGNAAIYQRIMDTGQILGINITQPVINETRRSFQLRCPQCGQLIENDADLVGFVEVNLLNLRSLILCKTCLENGL